MSITEKREINKDSKQLIENYLNMLYGDNKSDNTIDNYRIDLEMFVEYMESKDLSITETTLEQLEGYKAHLRNITYGNGKHYSENTRARRISSLREFYKYLFDREIITKNPAYKLTKPKVEQGAKPSFMTLEESKLVIDATRGATHENRDRLILKMFLKTGMRVSELANLDVTDIIKTTIVIRKGKGNKTRTVYINQEFADEIENYVLNRRYANGLALFTSQKGNRMSVAAIQNMVAKYIDKAGLNSDVLHVHSLRHSFSVIMLKNKVDITKIQKSLGHSSLKTTQIYTHVLDEEMQETANEMGDLFE